MCGIFGISINGKSDFNPHEFKRISRQLFLLSESRGKEASGFALADKESISVYKKPEPASVLIKSRIYKENISKILARNSSGGRPEDVVTLMGHSRLVTNGLEKFNENNQPVIKNGLVSLHNGIVVNVKELWKKYHDEKKISDLDSEIIFTLLRRFFIKGNNLKESVSNTFKEIYGMTSIAVIFEDLQNLLLATNNGSLYYVLSKKHNFAIFASESNILETIQQKSRLLNSLGSFGIHNVRPGEACLINLQTFEIDCMNISDSPNKRDFVTLNKTSNRNPFRDISEPDVKRNKLSAGGFHNVELVITKSFSKHFSDCEKKVKGLRRCFKCLLPSSFPFIFFNDDGICNYCHNYQKKVNVTEQELKKRSLKLKDIISKYKPEGSSRAKCIVPISGGRDSCYGLHYIIKELNMDAVTYTYDWGMVTPLARRNISRMCGKLGIENILVSANIQKKREYIQKNVLAWLKKPDIGIVPLFMAGDKYYFHFLNMVKMKTGIQLSVWLSNRLESTEFKVGFCGIKPAFQRKWPNYLQLTDKLKFGLYYLINFVQNPRYFNSSLIDTIGSYYSYFIAPRNDLCFMYDYVRWDEKIIEDTLIHEYQWETSPDTKSTWRIGDGSASFYNYIYFMLAGFTENDTFRSNQIREGMLTREDALQLINDENMPRWETIKWYCDTIGIDFESTINQINKIPPLYK